MEKKGRKLIFTKIIAIVCIFVVLQSYFSCFAQIAIAVNETLTENVANESSEDENLTNR